TMADVNVNSLVDQVPTMVPPTHTDDQILSHIRWVPIGKSNCYLDVEKSQNTLRDALQITPVNNNKAFSSPPSFDALINFVNELGYPKFVRNLSNVVTNDMFQPCRVLTTIINLCLTGKTSGFERPRALVLQILWGVINRAHIDYAERIWEEFTQSIHTFIKDKKKKATLIVFPSISSLRSVDESVAEGIPEKETKVDDEEANIQRALDESLKSIYDVPRVSLPSVVIRELESGKYQPLPKTPKKKSLADQFIFQRRTSTPTGSSGHDESKSLYVELGLMDGEVESGQAGPNPDEQDEGHVGPNPGDAAASQPLPSLVVHAGPNLKRMDLEVTHVSTQPHPEQIDEGFTATAYPKVQENLKLTVEEHVILEEPASSTGTLSYLQHLTKDLSFGDLFFNDKPSEADNEKTTTETKVKSMVSITIQQDTSAIPPKITPIVDLTSRTNSPNVHRPLQETTTKRTTTTTIHPPPPQPQQSTTDSMLMKRIDKIKHIMANLIQDNKHLEERLDSHGARLYTLENLDIPQQVNKAVDEIVAGAVDWAIQAPLQNHFRDLPEVDMKEILHQRMWETNSYKTHEDHMMLYEALEKSVNRDHSEKILKDLVEARKKKKKRRDSPKMPLGSPPHQPPPFPPPAGPSRTLGSPRASGSSCATTSSSTSIHQPRRCGFKRSASMILLLCMVFLTGGFKDNDSTLTDTHPRVIAELADLNEHIITERDFKYLYPSDFEDLYEVHMIIRFNEIHKFSDDTLHQIDETLDYRVKEFKVNRMNLDLNTRFWTRKDVDRSKEFMLAIQKRLKTRRIFRNLESFVGGQVRDGDYRLLKRTE
nr:hypothetical protein [Tanacetum cinerariifolium]